MLIVSIWTRNMLRGDGPYWEDDYPYTLPSEAVSPTNPGTLPVPPEATPANAQIPYYVKGVQFLDNVDALALTDATVMDAIEPTKQAIMDYGAVSTNIYQAHDGNGTYPYTDTRYYNEDTNAYFCDGNDGTYNHIANHAVAIVGWDDTYPRTNFKTQPTIDGAWICKDAQGTDFGEDGFYYVSYQSACVTTTQFCFTDVKRASTKGFNGIAQHDALGLTNFAGNDYGDWDGNDTYFNRFTAAEAGTLNSVGFYSMGKSASYKIYFIEDFSAFMTEVEGEWASSFAEFIESYPDYVAKEGTLTEAGWHVVDLDTPISLTQGQDYGIGLWMDFGTAVSYMPIEQIHPTVNGVPHYVFELACPTNPTSTAPVIGQGETYGFDPGSVYNMDGDCTIEDVGYHANPALATLFGNLCLKGYYSTGATDTDPAVPQQLTVVAQPQPVQVTEGNAVTFSIAAEGGKTPYTYEWQYSSDNGTTYLAVESGGNEAACEVSATFSMNGYQYRCVVTDAAGKSVTSNPATLTVTKKPDIDDGNQGGDGTGDNGNQGGNETGDNGNQGGNGTGDNGSQGGDETGDNGNQNEETRLEIKEGISEVPQGLMNTEYNTPEKIVGRLTQILANQTGYTSQHTATYDVTLLVSSDGGQTWTKATEDNFPAEGLTITLPYPNGTGQDTHNFIVTHMFTQTSSKLGTTAGETEQPAVTKTAEGIRFTVKGLSPIGVAWQEVTPDGFTPVPTPAEDTPGTPANPQTTNTGQPGAPTTTPGSTGSPNVSAPQTGDFSHAIGWIALLGIAGLILIGGFKKRILI